MYYPESFRILFLEDDPSGKIRFNQLLNESENRSFELKVSGSRATLLSDLMEFNPQIVLISDQFEKNPGPAIALTREKRPDLPIIIICQGVLSPPSKLSDLADDTLQIPSYDHDSLHKYIRYCIEKKQLVLQLNETRDRYQLLTKATNNIVWDWEIEKHSAYWVGNGLHSILGYDQYEMIVDANFWEENLHPEDRDRVMIKLNTIFNDACLHNWDDEYRFRNKDGTYSDIFDRGFIIYKEGKPTRMIGSMENVTARKLAEAASISSEQNYKNLFDFNPLATFIWDADNYNILEVNQSAIRDYGYDKETFLRLKVLDLRPKQEVDRFRERAKQVLNSEQLGHEYTWLHHNAKGEQMLMQVSSYKINYKGRTAVLALAKNVTGQTALEKKLEAERNLKQKQIAEAVVTAQERERTEIGKELHDNVNQLLSASRLYIEAAKNDENNGLALLSQASDYIMNAIEEIRVLSKALNTPLINELGLNESLDNLADDLMAVHDIRISVNKIGFSELGLHENFKLTVYRIIQEQVTNILKHSKATEALIELLRDDFRVILKIQDNGIGFDTNKKRKGIGLTNIKSRVDLYKGHLHIISEKGQGSSIYVEFPLDDTLDDNRTNLIRV